MPKKMFVFYLNNEVMNVKEYGLIVCVRKNVNSSSQLFEIFSSQLQFPPHFGKNWDALYDCLCDLEHLQKTKFLILHEDLPCKDLEEERKTYINLIFDIESCFASKPNCKVDVAFPVTLKNEIINYRN